MIIAALLAFAALLAAWLLAPAERSPRHAARALPPAQPELVAEAA
jgi:hypothetical protein